MYHILKTIYANYSSYWNEITDHRTDDWFLTGSPWKIIGITIAYLYFVRNLGPRLMKDRPAFNVDPVVRVYNLVQIFVNVYIVYKAHALGWMTTINWYCEPIDYSTTPAALQILYVIYLYTLVKILDLLDTVFFVLRKKNNQITFLHVYHHVLMALFVWICFKITPGGHGIFMGYINSWVHAVMYTYYFVTSMWPEYKKNIWWKKHVTHMQMLQFLLLFLHGLIPFFIECNYSLFWAFILTSQALVMVLLFSNFYFQTYIKKKTK